MSPVLELGPAKAAAQAPGGANPAVATALFDYTDGYQPLLVRQIPILWALRSGSAARSVLDSLASPHP